MRASVSKSNIKGKVLAPPSKSYTIRGLMCAALARGESKILNSLASDDTEAAAAVLSKIGVRLVQGEGFWQVSGGEFEKPDADLFCRESAATLRFMTAVASLVPGECRLTAAPSLAVRPVEPLLEALRQLGVDCFYRENEACVVVRRGLEGGTTEMPGDISSQFVSALLLISPLAEENVRIKLTTPLESKPYVLMTLECLKEFDIKVKYSTDLREFETERQAYRPAEYAVEGDWSSASYLLALGALCGEVEVGNLNPESLQGDRVIVDLLREMGAVVATGENTVAVKKSGLKAVRADLTDCIDLLPTLAVLAAVAEGVSEFTGIERARLKESNRVSALREGLERMGIRVTEESNKVIIAGSPASGAIIDTKADHRIAMAFGLLGAAVGGVLIDDAGCVAKTYPEFWDILESIGGEVKTDGKQFR